MKTSINLDSEFVQKAKQHAKLTGRTFSGLVTIGIKKVLESEQVDG